MVECHNDPEPVGEGDSAMHRGGQKAMEGPPTGGKGAPARLGKTGVREWLGFRLVCVRGEEQNEPFLALKQGNVATFGATSRRYRALN